MPVVTAEASSKPISGEIRVTSRIIDHLSSGLYETPAACLKELVNNAYDADASVVRIFVKPDADRIIIEDDGFGISAAEFQRHFDRVSESFKRDGSDATPSGRPVIGRIGIGFIAANEICDRVELISTKAGSGELLHVTIDFAKMRRPVTERRRDDDIAKADYEGAIERAELGDHYTWLFLSGIRGESRRILASVAREDRASGAISLYGRAPASVAKILGNSNLQNWGQLDAYSENFVHVGLNVPVPYLPGWIPAQWAGAAASFTKQVAALGFRVEVDGAPLSKPTIFPPPERSLFAKFAFTGKHVSATGYFYAQRFGLKPQNLQGLLLRVRNAAVGEYDPGFWGFPSDEAPLFQSWISGEIWAGDGLEDAVNIDRRSLRVVHPAYEELRGSIHEFLHGFFKRVRAELHSEPAKARRQGVAVAESQRVSDVVTEPSAAVSASTRQLIQSAWRIPDAADDQRAVRDLLRKFTVSELYRVAIEAARESLTPEQADKFIEALTRRLRG